MHSPVYGGLTNGWVSAAAAYCRASRRRLQTVLGRPRSLSDNHQAIRRSGRNRRIVRAEVRHGDETGHLQQRLHFVASPAPHNEPVVTGPFALMTFKGMALGDDQAASVRIECRHAAKRESAAVGRDRLPE